MDKREALKSMLNNLINDKPEEATLDFHNYITAKSREVAGMVPKEVDVPEVPDDTSATPAGGETEVTDPAPQN